MPVVPRDRSDFGIAIFCALPLEAENVQGMFDKCWEDEGRQYSKAVGDQNTYTTGVIGSHNVVLVHMPIMGGISAALSAAGLRSSFPGIQLALVVGICGVVPVHAKTQEEIVLGDIVISTAVTQYDFGRQYPNGFQRKREIDDSLGRASPTIQSFVNMLQTSQNRRRWTKKLAELVRSKDFQENVPAAKYPGEARDRLYEASYLHQHRPKVSCEKCYDNLETCPKSCDEIGCEENKLIPRGRYSLQETAEMATVSDHTPFIHLGRFGSASTVMKSGTDRDRIAAADEVIAFEMEGAGVWEQHPTVVIKAACDYADSHKNKYWQAYAAAMAAAGLKVFLTEWIVPDQPANRDESSGPIWHMPFDQRPEFFGRTNELERLKQMVFETNGRRVAILGLGGVGKSRLALELVDYIHSEHPRRSIFWIQAADQLTFEEDVLEIGRKLRIPGIEDKKADIKSLVKQRLSNSSAGQWFLILDNADDELLWGRRSDLREQIYSLVDSLPRTTNGSILITTRTRSVASFLAGKEVVALEAMSPDEASEMFDNGLETPGLASDRISLSALLERLAYLPLAIVQAVSYVNMTQRAVRTYLELLDRSEVEVIKLLSKDFGDPTRYPNARNPVATTWLISFDHIRQHHQLASSILSCMACLHEKFIPLTLLPEEGSRIDVIDAIAVLTGYSFVARRRTGSGGIADLEEFYDMHQLVQLAARNWLKTKGSFAYWTKVCITRMTQIFPTRDHQNKSVWTLYLPHAQRLCAESCVEELSERYDLLEKMGLCSVVDGKYTEAVRMHTATVKFREDALGTSEQATLSAYNNLGEALNCSGDWSVAEGFLQRAVNGQLETLGPEHPSTLACMFNLASAYRNQGRWTQAEELEVQVMETSSRVLGAEHPSTLTSMAGLASTYWKQGRWTQAEELEVQVMETKKRVLGAEHPSTLTSMNNLAGTLKRQGRDDEAMLLITPCLELFKKVAGPSHPHTQIVSNTLMEWLGNEPISGEHGAQDSGGGLCRVT